MLFRSALAHRHGMPVQLGEHAMRRDDTGPVLLVPPGDAMQPEPLDEPESGSHPVEQFHTIGLLSRLPIESATPLPDPPFERALLLRATGES